MTLTHRDADFLFGVSCLVIPCLLSISRGQAVRSRVARLGIHVASVGLAAGALVLDMEPSTRSAVLMVALFFVSPSVLDLCGNGASIRETPRAAPGVHGVGSRTSPTREDRRLSLTYWCVSIAAMLVVIEVASRA